jgi:hypothetical protein
MSTTNIRIEIYEARMPAWHPRASHPCLGGRRPMGWSGFVEDQDGYSNLGWHASEIAARRAAEQVTAEALQRLNTGLTGS